jgi:hypothetical protein
LICTPKWSFNFKKLEEITNQILELENVKHLQISPCFSPLELRNMLPEAVNTS